VVFDGVFSGTSDKAMGEINAEVFSNEQSSERRVILKVSGNAFDLTQGRNVEGVRVRNDYYLVDQNKACVKTTEPTAGQVADLGAGALVGGIKKAAPNGQRKTENKFDTWEYTFSPDDVIPPTLQLSEGGTIAIAAGDLWVAPSVNAVWQYTISLNVENILLQSQRQLSGQVRATYQLLDTGVRYDIAIPYGC
jgi:hypothetical protein